MPFKNQKESKKNQKKCEMPSNGGGRLSRYEVSQSHDALYGLDEAVEEEMIQAAMRRAEARAVYSDLTRRGGALTRNIVVKRTAERAGAGAGARHPPSTKNSGRGGVRASASAASASASVSMSSTTTNVDGGGRRAVSLSLIHI